MNAINGFLESQDQTYQAKISKRVIITIALIVLTLASGGVWLRQDMRKSQRVAAEQTAQNLSVGLERAMRDATGRGAGISIDITERRKIEDRLRPAIRDALEGRLQALSTAHDVLTREAGRALR